MAKQKKLSPDLTVQALDLLKELKATDPSTFYQPSQPTARNPWANQLGFHVAPHTIRALFPGNRWGKTAAMAQEVAEWVGHTNRWSKTPSEPVTVLWFTLEYRQWELLRQDVERKAWPSGWSWNATNSIYTWPNGDRVFIISSDRSWRYIQGINPDLVMIDEQCPSALWGELLIRGTGDRATRYCIGATATLGMSWMYESIYQPWLAFHHELGLTELEAAQRQEHHRLWVWPHGGVADNPSMGERQIEGFMDAVGDEPDESLARVRREGGFADLGGDAVFPPDLIDRLMDDAERMDEDYGPGVKGGFAYVPKADPEDIGPVFPRGWHKRNTG